jgi:hypothetical protein
MKDPQQMNFFGFYPKIQRQDGPHGAYKALSLGARFFKISTTADGT